MPADPSELPFANGDDEAGEASFGMVFSGGEDKRPVRDLYSIFGRPPTEADREASALARRCGLLDTGADNRAERKEFGDVIAANGRLLLAGLGGADDALFAAPTTTEYIVHAILPNGGGGCGRPGPDGLILAGTTSRKSLVLLGLIEDAIVGVDVRVGKETLVARMGENAFGLRIQDTGGATLEALVLGRRDGSVSEIDLRGLMS